MRQLKLIVLLVAALAGCSPKSRPPDSRRVGMVRARLGNTNIYCHAKYSGSGQFSVRQDGQLFSRGTFQVKDDLRRERNKLRSESFRPVSAGGCPCRLKNDFFSIHSCPKQGFWTASGIGIKNFRAEAQRRRGKRKRRAVQAGGGAAVRPQGWPGRRHAETSFAWAAVRPTLCGDQVATPPAGVCV